MILKSHFCKQRGPRSDCSSRSSLIRVHTVCLYAKIGLKSLQEYSADDMYKQTTFSDAGFLEILKVKMFRGIVNSLGSDQSGLCLLFSCHFVRNFGVRNFRTFTVIVGLHCLHVLFCQKLWCTKF